MTQMTHDAKKPAKKLHQFILGPTDDSILRAICRYHYMTIDQVTRLLYSKGSRTTASTRLKRLADGEYLQRIIVPTRVGTGPVVYALSRKGMKFVAQSGAPLPARARPSETREHSYLFFAHTLAINDFLINVELFAAGRPDRVVVQQMLHERDLKRQPVLVDDGASGKLAVIPDAYLDLALSGQYRACLALELDRGTEEQKAWRKKVRALLAYVGGPYQAAFGTEALTICVVATPGQARLQQLYSWTTSELDAQGKRAEADLFRFAAFAPAALAPEQMLLGAGWHVPYQTTPVALIDRAWLSGGSALAPAPGGRAGAPSSHA